MDGKCSNFYGNFYHGRDTRDTVLLGSYASDWVFEFEKSEEISSE